MTKRHCLNLASLFKNEIPLHVGLHIQNLQVCTISNITVTSFWLPHLHTGKSWSNKFKRRMLFSFTSVYLWPFPHSLLSLREGKTVKMLLPKHCSRNTKLPWYFPVNLILLTWTTEKLAAHYANNWTTSHMTVICNSRVILQINDAITGVNDPTTLKLTLCTINISGFSLPQWATHRNLG